MSHHGGFDAARTVSPLTTLMRGVIEWGFPVQSGADLHAEFSPGCQTRKLSIDAVCSPMVQVVAGSRRSVFAAFQADQVLETPTITASHQAEQGSSPAQQTGVPQVCAFTNGPWSFPKPCGRDFAC